MCHLEKTYNVLFKRVMSKSYKAVSSTHPVQMHQNIRIFNCCEMRINRIHHLCSVGTVKSQPESPPLQWETSIAKFPTGTVDPRVVIFLSTLNVNDRFFFSNTITQIVVRMTPLCSKMEMSEEKERNKFFGKVKQFWNQIFPFVSN